MRYAVGVEILLEPLEERDQQLFHILLIDVGAGLVQDDRVHAREHHLLQGDAEGDANQVGVPAAEGQGRTDTLLVVLHHDFQCVAHLQGNREAHLADKQVCLVQGILEEHLQELLRAVVVRQERAHGLQISHVLGLCVKSLFILLETV